MRTALQHKNSPRLFGLIMVIYGLVYILIDRIDYFIQSTNRGILSQAYPESLMMRIVNLILCISLIVGGYFLIRKNKDSWYLINFASIGILFKYVFTNFFLPPFSFGNFLSFTLIHGIFALICLIYTNSKRFKNQLLLHVDMRLLKLTYLILIAIGTVLLYGFEEIKWIEKNNKKHFQEVIYDSHKHDFHMTDTCHYDKEFLTIFDTLNSIEDYTSIEIVSLNKDSIPTYSEKVSLFEMNVISKFYRYDSTSKTVTITRDSRMFNKSFDTLNFVFDTLPDFLVYPVDENYDYENATADIFYNKNQTIKIVTQYDKETKKMEEKDLIIFTLRSIN
jgi:hypothetical protein